MTGKGGARISTVEEARAALDTPDAEIRRLVVRALERSPTDVACAVLRRALGDDDWRVRKEAVQLAHAIADRAPEPIAPPSGLRPSQPSHEGQPVAPVNAVLPILVDALRASSEEVALRNAAVEALACIGAAAAEAVEAVLAERDPPLDADQRKLAVEVLAAARMPRSLDAVIDAAHDPDVNVRAAATEAIGAIGGEAAIPALLQILDRTTLAPPPADRAPDTGESRLLRLVALEGLNRLDAHVSLEQLLPLVGDKILRPAAVAALARTGDAGAFAPIASAIVDASRHVAEAAIRSFGVLRRELPRAPEAQESVRALDLIGRQRVVAATRSEDASLRRGALAVLAALGDPPSIDLLVRALADADVADDAESALVAHLDRALPRLVEAARGSSISPAKQAPSVRAPALEAASKDVQVGALRLVARFAARPPAMDALRDALHHGDADVVAAAAAGFACATTTGGTPTEVDVRALLRAAARREPHVASTALLALRSLARKDADAVRPLLDEIDAESEAAPIGCALLAVIGGAQNVPWLSRAISAESPRTRRAAVEALGEIGGEAAARAIALAVTDEVSDVALAAIRALGRMRDESGEEAPGVPALLRLLESTDDPALVSAAVRAVGATESPAAANALRPLVSSSASAVACAALEALADLRVDDLPELAFSALSHRSSVVVRASLDVMDGLLAAPHPRLAAATDREALLGQIVGHATRALGHASWEVRRRAAEVLPQCAVGSAASALRPLLSERAATEDEPAVREAMHHALVEIEVRLGLRSAPPARGDR